MLPRSPSLVTNAPGKRKRKRSNSVDGASYPISHTSRATPEYELLMWSARDEAALRRMLHLYDGYIKTHVHGDAKFLRDLAYTLSARRTLMPWRSFSVVQRQAPPEDLDLTTARCERAVRDVGGAFIFTGQGAQYANMGMQLLRYPIFKDTLAEADAIFKELGAEWSLFGKHSKLSLLRHWRRTAFVNSRYDRYNYRSSLYRQTRVQSASMHCAPDSLSRATRNF